MNAVVSMPIHELGNPHIEAQPLSQTFVVPVQQGLHARPCALLIKTLLPFRSTVEVEVEGNKASGKSILGLMSLGAVYGSEITFTVLGEDAAQALAALQHLFVTGFQDAYSASASRH
jgi:phosphotransferase system HPr (HPr) family protein